MMYLDWLLFNSKEPVNAGHVRISSLSRSLFHPFASCPLRVIISVVLLPSGNRGQDSGILLQT